MPAPLTPQSLCQEVGHRQGLSSGDFRTAGTLPRSGLLEDRGERPKLPLAAPHGAAAETPRGGVGAVELERGAADLLPGLVGDVGDGLPARGARAGVRPSTGRGDDGAGLLEPLLSKVRGGSDVVDGGGPVADVVGERTVVGRFGGGQIPGGGDRCWSRRVRRRATYRRESSSA